MACVARGGRRDAAAAGAVADLVRASIERALPHRRRYKYVQARVEAEAGAWLVLSPNCSRNVRADGGEIPVARLEPSGDGTWSLQARDHAVACWVGKADGLSLAAALARLCDDPAREFWP